MGKTLLAALALALTAAAPAEAATAVFVAYGEGATVCRIEVSKFYDSGSIWTGGEDRTSFYGRTDCNVPVEQTGHATVPDGGYQQPAMDGGLCSGLTTSCYSGQTNVHAGNDNPMTYRMSLRAPLGQGWIGVPTNCTGVGTDNLKCEFSIDNLTGFGV